jgi:hypothetical protein
MECKVNKIIALGNEGGAGNLVICEVVKMHIDTNVLDKNGSIDQHKLDLVARAGGSYYSRGKKGFFEIPKPLSTLGIGVDNLPTEVKNSKIFTGNDLGLLANVEALPNKENVNKFSKENPNYIGMDSTKKHKFAKSFLDKKEVISAWKILLTN